MPRGRKTGGRQKGTPNKLTVERQRQALEELKERARRAELSPLAKDEVAALIPEAKELLGVVKGIVGRFQRMAMAQDAPDAAWEKLKEWMGLYAEVMLKASQIAYRAADFQSPKFRAIAVVAPQQQQVLPPPIEGDNVVRLDDPQALARVYQRRVTAAR